MPQRKSKSPKVVSKKPNPVVDEEEEIEEIDETDETSEEQVDLAEEMKGHKQMVTISVTRLLDPPPIIGTWIGAHETQVKMWKPGEKYRVPYDVAMHLSDANAVIV